jgi:hypothetical protein
MTTMKISHELAELQGKEPPADGPALFVRGGRVRVYLPRDYTNDDVLAVAEAAETFANMVRRQADGGT